MPEVKVPKSGANVSNGSLLDTLVTQNNALAAAMNALLAKMDTDFADVTNASTDYAATIGTMDTIGYSGE